MATTWSSRIPRNATLRPGLRKQEQQPDEAGCLHTSAVCQAECPASTSTGRKQPAGVIMLLRDLRCKRARLFHSIPATLGEGSRVSSQLPR